MKGTVAMKFHDVSANFLLELQKLHLVSAGQLSLAHLAQRISRWVSPTHAISPPDRCKQASPAGPVASCDKHETAKQNKQMTQMI